MNNILSFGARKVYDPLLREFANSANGKFIEYEKEVGRTDITKWINFDYHQWLWDKNPICVFGVLRGTEQLLWTAKQHNIDYYYFDHGYFDAAPNTIDGKYRIIKNGENINLLKYDSTMFDYETEPKNGGNKIIVCPPSEYTARYYRFDIKAWLSNIIQQIKRKTNMEIVIREKNTNVPLKTHLNMAHSVVTLQSTVACKAVMSGVHSICYSNSPAYAVSSHTIDFSKLAYPKETYKNKWIETLHNCCFTKEEIQNGVAWKKIREYQK